MIPRPKRVLIDWDLGASGIWLIVDWRQQRASAQDGEEPELVGFGGPWSDVLPADLLAALQDWNDAAEEFSRPESTPAAGRLQRKAALRQRGRELAERVQDELGAEWEVLYNAGGDGWSWTWVWPPSEWGD